MVLHCGQIVPTIVVSYCMIFHDIAKEWEVLANDLALYCCNLLINHGLLQLGVGGEPRTRLRHKDLRRIEAKL
jgi:hypothetical protein